MYNYLESMKADIKQYLEENLEYMYSNVESLEELQEELQENLWAEDNVTGNASGSYTFCRETAKGYVLDNMDLCIESLKEFCVESETIAEKFLNENWEYFDVTIRCYLLSQAISELLEDDEEDFNNCIANK